MTAGDEDASPKQAQRLVVKKRGRIELVPVAELLFVQGADNYVELVLRDGRRELYDNTLTATCKILPADFIQIHRSYLVRLGAVQRIQIHGGSQYTVELVGGIVLPVGRTYYKALKAKLQDAASL